MRLRGMAAATAAALALGGASLGLAQSPSPTAPAAESFRLGAFELTSLRDAEIVMPNNGHVFGAHEGPDAVAKVLSKAGAPTDKITLGADGLLVREPGHVVLIDTGLGPAAHGVLAASLALAHVAPSEVTDVLITHSHFDHVGGLLTATGGSAFPKAVIRMASKEWAYLQSGDNKALVAAIAPQVKTFEPGEAILPGITPIAIEGHTPGHVGYEIVSRGHHLLDIGDAAHSSIISLAKPDWEMGFDGDKALGAKSRRALLTHLAANHEEIFAPHFPFPCVGRIHAEGDGFVFQPATLRAP